MHFFRINLHVNREKTRRRINESMDEILQNVKLHTNCKLIPGVHDGKRKMCVSSISFLKAQLTDSLSFFFNWRMTLELKGEGKRRAAGFWFVPPKKPRKMRTTIFIVQFCRLKSYIIESIGIHVTLKRHCKRREKSKKRKQ